MVSGVQRERNRDRNRETGRRSADRSCDPWWRRMCLKQLLWPLNLLVFPINWTYLESQSAELRSSVEVSLMGHRTKWRRLDSESNRGKWKVLLPFAPRKNKESSLILSLWIYQEPIYQPIYLIDSTVQMYSDSDHFSPLPLLALLWHQHHLVPFTSNSSTSTLDSIWNFKHFTE